MSPTKAVINWQLYLGFVLVVTGGLFLVDQLLGLNIITYFWPLLVLLFGITFFVGMFLAGKKGSGLAIPGAVLTTIGFMLFLQNLLNLWVTWAYSWALLISATGVGILIMNRYLKQDGLRRVAGLIIGVGLILFVIFGVLFEIILNIAGNEVNSGIFLASGLILLGIFVIFSRSFFKRRDKSAYKRSGGNQSVDVEFEDSEGKVQVDETVAQSFSIPEGFTGVHFESVGDVFIYQGDTSKLQIDGDLKLRELVNIEVRDGILWIVHKSDITDWMGLKWVNFKGQLRYYVTVKDLSLLNFAGAGTIRSEKLKGQNLSITHTGAGKVTLKSLNYEDLDVDFDGLGEVQIEGQVLSQNVDLSGAGTYQAVSLQSKQANIDLSGAGSAWVWVEANLNAHLSGAGSIKYKGEPEIEQFKAGLGRIEPL